MSQTTSYIDPYRPLIDKIQSGIDREDSLRELYQLTYPKVLRYFLRRGYAREDSEELTQDVFSRVLEGIDGFRGDAPFGGWLFGIAENIRQNDHRRRNASKRRGPTFSYEALLEGGAERAAPESLILGKSSEPDALSKMLAEERRKAFHRAISGMPPRMQNCCFLRYLQGMKYRDIAVMMKISDGAVKSHLSQAKKRLQEEFGFSFESESED
jgi:RNA polymerase sigma-70 factor (ECF subfamily)